MRTLKNDDKGTAIWIEREARGMDPMQLYREFVQNGIEATATRIVIDGWRDPETGHLLARITDNGTGLTGNQMIERLTNLHVLSGASNYGVGARIAALPRNQAGVTFASRTVHGEEMITLHKARGEYGTKSWNVEDDDGDIVQEEVVDPDDGMLNRLAEDSTGTVVILHGDGHSDTWDPSTGYQVHKFLTRRYYEFGSDASIFVQDLRDGDSSLRLRPVQPVGEYLAIYGQADGEIPFHNVGGLNGVIFWWIIPSSKESRSEMMAAKVIPGGVGLVVDNEVFYYDKTYLGDFGIIYPSVQARVALLVFVDGAEMDTARAGVVLPGENRKTTPWKKLGGHFADNMPDEIDDLLSTVTANSQSFDVEMAKMLDPEWMKKLLPVRVPVPTNEGDPMTGDEKGNAVPPGEDIEVEHEPVGPKPKKKSRAAERKNNGSDPGKEKPKVVTPQVEFTEDFPLEAHPFGITWFQNVNKVLIWAKFPPFIREIDRWCEKVSVPRSIVEASVRNAYQIEFAATVIDANVQSKYQLDSEMIEQLKSDAALYAKALGMQALTERIADYIKTATRNA